MLAAEDSDCQKSDQGGGQALEETVLMADREVAEGLTAVVYGMFALEQDVPLEGLRRASAGAALQAHKPQTPEWFAAAASENATLLDTAPELLAMEPGNPAGSPEQVVRADSDIIGIYAPDGPAYRRGAPPREDAAPVVDEPARDADLAPRTSVQMGLLKELSDLDT